MSPVEILAILGMTAWAIYKQTVVTEVRAKGRFKMAAIYGVVAIVVGGFAQPHGATAWALLLVGIALSVAVGLARGFLTRIWTEPDGRVLRQGTVLTVALFLGLVLSKFVLGAIAQADHVNDGAGFGEVMLMIAVMVAFQAEVVWRRAAPRVLAQTAPTHTVTA